MIKSQALKKIEWKQKRSAVLWTHPLTTILTGLSVEYAIQSGKQIGIWKTNSSNYKDSMIKSQA